MEGVKWGRHHPICIFKRSLCPQCGEWIRNGEKNGRGNNSSETIIGQEMWVGRLEECSGIKAVARSQGRAEGSMAGSDYLIECLKEKLAL